MNRYLRAHLEAVIKPDMREEPFRREIRDLAESEGWTLRYHTHDSRRSDGGWPDEVYIHPLYGRAVFLELKAKGRKPTPNQVKWLLGLNACGLETAVWYPKDLETIIDVLGPNQVKTKWVPKSL